MRLSAYGGAKMKIFSQMMILAGVTLIAVPAHAKHQITKIVKKNTTTDISDNFTFGKNCSQGNFIETGYVIMKPAHGSVTIVEETVAVTQKRFNFARPFGCAGATTLVQFVRYTPENGYVGPDDFSVTWGNNAASLTYRFVVK